MHCGVGGGGDGDGGSSSSVGHIICVIGSSGCVANKSSSISSNIYVTIWSVNHHPDTASLAVFHVYHT